MKTKSICKGGDAAAHVFSALLSGETRAPDFVALHGSAANDPRAIQSAATQAGVTTVHGGTSCRGVMANGAVDIDGRALGAFAIWDAEGDYGAAAAAFEGAPRRVAADAMRRALLQAGRPGEAPDLVWLSVAPGCEEAVLSGIEDVVGPSTPIIGGSVADDDISGAWGCYDRTTACGDGLVVSALFPSRPISWAYQSGYAPSGRLGVATRVEGRRVIEIDGRPAFDVYQAASNGAIAPPTADGPTTILSESTFHPIGREVDSVAEIPFYLLAHPAVANPDGSIALFADVDQGEELFLMSGSETSLVSRAGRVAALSAKRANFTPGEIAGALIIYCAGCMLSVENQMSLVASEVNAAVGGAPSLGIFTFGEQGPVELNKNHHGNLMISCALFSR